MSNQATDRNLSRWFAFLKVLTRPRPRRPSPKTAPIGELSFIIFVFAGLCIAVWLFIMIVGPMFPASKKSLANSEKAAGLAVAALMSALPDRTALVDRRFGYNLDLYVDRKAFEDIPYPDRKAAVEKIARAWCNNIEYPWFPRVKVFDIRSGKRLSTHVCAFSKLRESFFKPSSPATSTQTVPADKVTSAVDAKRP